MARLGRSQPFRPIMQGKIGLDQSLTNSETITVVDTVLKLPARIFSEVAAIFDTIVTQKIKAGEFTDVITVVDTIIRFPARILTDVVAVVDTFIYDLGRVLSEVVTVVDTSLKQSIRVLTESVTVVDLVEKSVGYIRTFTEVIPVVDTIAKLRAAYKELTESFTVVEEFIIKIKGRILTETVALADSIVKRISGILSLFRREPRLTNTFTKEELKND